jgi:hypothetical protein
LKKGTEMTKLEAAQVRLQQAQEALNIAAEQYRGALTLLIDALDESTREPPQKKGHKTASRDLVWQQRKALETLLSAIANSKICLILGQPAIPSVDPIEITDEEKRIALINSLPGKYGNYHSTVEEFLRQRYKDAERENDVRGNLAQ